VKHGEHMREVAFSEDSNAPSAANVIGVACDIADADPVARANKPPEHAG
jgi:hypothetical protein